VDFAMGSPPLLKFIEQQLRLNYQNATRFSVRSLLLAWFLSNPKEWGETGISAAVLLWECF
jgi:hypothetical protein